jgi:pimeloyl-ACP methyl ester carboxylesterase
MRTPKRELYLCVTLLAVPAAESRSQQSPRLQFGSAQFKSAAGDSVAADTATLLVPENRLNRSTRQISVAVVRFRSEADGVPLIYISGGSGAGISAARGPRFPFFLALRDIGDVIVFDIRGAGRSSPRLSCNVSLNLNLGEPLTRSELVTATRRANSACADSLRAKGFDLNGYNGREVVTDIDDIRKALGVPKIRLFGTSTGTHIALEYLRRHPSRVASVFLAGTEGPGQTAHLPTDLDTTVMRLAARESSRSLLDLMKSVFAALDAKPVSADTKGTTVGIGGYDARVFVASTLGDRKQMAMLVPLFSAMKAGTYAPVAGLKLQAMNTPFQSPWESLHDCAAGSSPARMQLVRAQSRTALLGYATLDFAEACDGWGTNELDRSYRAPVKSKVPTMFISGSLDGRTPISNAEEVRKGFPNSSHLIVDGASHGDDLFISAPDILREVIAFAHTPNRATKRVDVRE